MFLALQQYTHGRILDIGGGSFHQTAIKHNIKFNTWTVLENSKEKIRITNNPRIMHVLADGCQISFPDDTFDTVLNIQVLEHVFEPIIMVNEMSRVLKENGHLILLVPQTSTIYMAPHHYYNFTRFWIEEAVERTDMRILEIEHLGGVWSSMASHLVYFFLQSIRYPGMSTKNNTRNIFFYILYPLMVIFAVIAIPICLILSIGDLTEEPNNYFIVAVNKHNKSVK
jgi:SAM-dependent methyltransferase